MAFNQGQETVIVMREFGRKLIHIISGIVILFALGYLGKDTFISFGMPLLLVGLITIQFEIQKFRLPVFSTIFSLFERRGVMPGKGAIWYAVGVMISIAFLPNPLMTMVIIALTVGDGFATLLGRYGKFRNPFNPKKTIEGSLWFIASSLVVLNFFFGVSLLSFSFFVVAAVIESFSLHIDDNLRIALLGLCFLVFYSQ